MISKEDLELSPHFKKVLDTFELNAEKLTKDSKEIVDQTTEALLILQNYRLILFKESSLYSFKYFEESILNKLYESFPKADEAVLKKAIVHYYGISVFRLNLVTTAIFALFFLFLLLMSYLFISITYFYVCAAFVAFITLAYEDLKRFVEDIWLRKLSNKLNKELKY